MASTVSTIGESLYGFMRTQTGITHTHSVHRPHPLYTSLATDPPKEWSNPTPRSPELGVTNSSSDGGTGFGSRTGRKRLGSSPTLSSEHSQKCHISLKENMDHPKALRSSRFNILELDLPLHHAPRPTLESTPFTHTSSSSLLSQRSTTRNVHVFFITGVRSCGVPSISVRRAQTALGNVTAVCANIFTTLLTHTKQAGCKLIRDDTPDAPDGGRGGVGKRNIRLCRPR